MLVREGVQRPEGHQPPSPTQTLKSSGIFSKPTGCLEGKTREEGLREGRAHFSPCTSLTRA